MIRKFIRRVLRIGTGREPDIVPRDRHGVAREAISHGARRVCEALHAEGFQAYVVGGAVRDLLLGVRPKDFDVATNALPEDVHRLFRRSRLIGRRFTIVHVMFGAETVEVSTFRAGGAQALTEPADASDSAPSPEPPAPEPAPRRTRMRRGLGVRGRLVDEHGRVTRDNVFGTREQDAARRDFTVNALYYDPSTESILDFHGGLRDLRRHMVRMIGNAGERYREDPVRMLRAVRFAAKLGFALDERTRAPIRDLAGLVANIPPARVYDEMQKLLLSGHALACVHRLRIEGLHHGVLPLLDVILEQPLGERFVNLALEQTDERVRSARPVSPAFLFAALLWHEVLVAWKRAEREGARPVPALAQAMDAVLEIQTETLAIPRRFTAVMREIWLMQPRFEQRTGKRALALLAQERYRAGWDFLALRAASGEVPDELAQWWERFEHADETGRSAMLVAAPAGETAGRRRRRRRPRRPAAGAGAPESTPQ